MYLYDDGCATLSSVVELIIRISLFYSEYLFKVIFNIIISYDLLQGKKKPFPRVLHPPFFRCFVILWQRLQLHLSTWCSVSPEVKQFFGCPLVTIVGHLLSVVHTIWITEDHLSFIVVIKMLSFICSQDNDSPYYLSMLHRVFFSSLCALLTLPSIFHIETDNEGVVSFNVRYENQLVFSTVMLNLYPLIFICQNEGS